MYFYLSSFRGLNFNENDIETKTDRRSHHGIYYVDFSGRPMNPVGRTGMTGRGLLGKWGPNHAADPIVTRWSDDVISGKRVLEFVAIKRRDTGEWAIPGVI